MTSTFTPTQVDWTSNTVEADCDSRGNRSGFRVDWPHRGADAGCSQTYRDPAGIIILIELKNRQRDCVSLADVIELSAQRVAVMAETGRQVALHAYVIVQGPSGRRVAHRVGLLDVVEVKALIQRREAILIGKATPRCSRSVHLCSGCGFRRRCVEVPLISGL